MCKRQSLSTACYSTQRTGALRDFGPFYFRRGSYNQIIRTGRERRLGPQFALKGAAGWPRSIPLATGRSLVLTAAPLAAVSEKQDEKQQQDRHRRERHRLPDAPRLNGDTVNDQRETPAEAQSVRHPQPQHGPALIGRHSVEGRLRKEHRHQGQGNEVVEDALTLVEVQ